MTQRMDIIGAEGTPMRVLLIPAREQNPNFPAAINLEHDIVEFYDLRHMHTPDGQFTGGRYLLETLQSRDIGSWGQGLNLYCGVPSWRITFETLSIVLVWANYHISRGVYRT